MPRPHRILGITIGLLAAGAVLALWRPGAAPPRGPMVSECDGPLRTLVIQYIAGADFAAAVYRQFLPQLPPEVEVVVQCPDRAAYDQLTQRVGPLRCRIPPIFVGHPMTAWSRDRWVALSPGETGAPVTVIAPRGEVGADVWPQRKGDQQLAADLAHAMASRVKTEPSSLYFDGGDLLADDSHVFVTPDVALRNVQHTVANVEELRQELARLTGKAVVLLPDAPRHHAGMFMMSIGQRTVLVGDPSLGKRLYVEGQPQVPDGADFSPETQAAFDSVAAAARDAGYRIVRIPVVPSYNTKTYLTYVNVIIDRRGGESIVYMPIYAGTDALNDAAERVWREQGFTVRRIDCTGTYPHGGNLHCLVNVLERG